jgi:signal transduction protein with GAF and PtsI domain
VKKLNENPSRPVDDDSNDSIEISCKKLAEIVSEKQQETYDILDEVKRQVNKQASAINNQLVPGLKQAKTVSDEGDHDRSHKTD